MKFFIGEYLKNQYFNFYPSNSFLCYNVKCICPLAFSNSHINHIIIFFMMFKFLYTLRFFKLFVLLYMLPAHLTLIIKPIISQLGIRSRKMFRILPGGRYFTSRNKVQLMNFNLKKVSEIFIMYSKEFKSFSKWRNSYKINCIC